MDKYGKFSLLVHKSKRQTQLQISKVWNIESLYPSISETLLGKALQFATKYEEIPKEKVHI